MQNSLNDCLTFYRKCGELKRSHGNVYILQYAYILAFVEIRKRKTNTLAHLHNWRISSASEKPLSQASTSP